MTSMRIRPLALLVTLGLGLAGSAVAQGSADGFPTKPIRLIVPYEPGGGTDLVMRAIAPGMGEALGQSVIVENKPGGGTIIATDAVARSAPDGYQLLAVGAPIYLNAALGVKTPYDPLRDLVPVSLLVNIPGLLLVGSSVSAKNVNELVALSKAQSGGLNYAAATNSMAHFAGELMKARIGINMSHIPYKGSAPVLTALMGGQVPIAVDGLIPSGVQAKAGKVRALAILSNERHPMLPDVPTMAEAGFPALNVGGTFGLMLPAKTPPAVITKIYAAMQKSISNPATRKLLEDMGCQVIANTPDQFGTYLRDQITTWTKIAKDSNIKSE